MLDIFPAYLYNGFIMKVTVKELKLSHYTDEVQDKGKRIPTSVQYGHSYIDIDIFYYKSKIYVFEFWPFGTKVKEVDY